MKLLNVISSTMVSIALFASCTSGKTKAVNDTKDESAKEQKVLVAYFSATGVTKSVAEKIARAADATLFEIEPEIPYTAADLDWRNKQSRSTVEMRDKETSRPAIKDKVSDMAQYNIVFVGFPVWWYTCPTIINTFLESYNFDGKTIVPFATSGGSPIEPCVTDMEKSAPGATFRDAKLLNDASQDAVDAWVKTVLN